MPSNNSNLEIKKIIQKNSVLLILLCLSMIFFGGSFYIQTKNTNPKIANASDNFKQKNSNIQNVDLAPGDGIKFTLKYSADLDLKEDGSKAGVFIEIGDYLIIDKITDVYDLDQNGELNETPKEICKDFFNLDNVHRKSLYYTPISANSEDSCSGEIIQNSQELSFSPLKRGIFGQIEIYAQLNPEILSKTNLHTDLDYKKYDLLSPELNFQGVKSVFRVQKIDKEEEFSSEDNFAIRLIEN
jgi:hypothetical protein